MLPDFKLKSPESTSSIEIRPLTPNDVDVDYVKARLTEGRVNLNLTESERDSLAEKKFITLHEGRGLGVAAALGHDKAVEFLGLSYELIDPTKKLPRGNDKSASRGMHQWVADLVQLAVDPSPTAESIELFCTRTNQRVFAGYTSKNRPQSFRDIHKSGHKLASVPPDSIPKIWNFLTTSVK